MSDNAYIATKTQTIYSGTFFHLHVSFATIKLNEKKEIISTLRQIFQLQIEFVASSKDRRKKLFPIEMALYKVECVLFYFALLKTFYRIDAYQIDIINRFRN